jgi:hypothetical protein
MGQGKPTSNWVCPEIDYFLQFMEVLIGKNVFFKPSFGASPWFLLVQTTSVAVLKHRLCLCGFIPIFCRMDGQHRPHKWRKVAFSMADNPQSAFFHWTHVRV